MLFTHKLTFHAQDIGRATYAGQGEAGRKAEPRLSCNNEDSSGEDLPSYE